ncbi:DNA polymerase [Methylohalomonas lacus]|uniref:Type-4 uracil-DNA glycosylase n=1 Tax=Methylohalomonas lacus TaxID=398773 RepID=A0AAE3HKC5_9GAMM|nr:uracil-DNA glycosylase [Methylohalomonas lacus]MCS3903906.1 DNA polymerase [Methylohalomonas lacus]
MSDRAAGLSERQRQYLQALDIPVWRSRAAVDETAAESQAVAAQAAEPVAAPLGADVTAAWSQLEREVVECTKCELYRTRTQAVFGVGNRQADWLIVGEAPGRDEDQQGEPFVGRAGKLLNAMLEALGYAREDVYIANILKSRPPKNRDPKPEEVAACEPYLKQQIALLKPKIILAVGRVAAQNLLKTDTPIGKLRGQRLEYQVAAETVTKVPVVVTYHPAYLLRSPADKRKAWQDLLLARQIYHEARSGAAA